MNKRYTLDEYAEMMNRYLDGVLPECDFGEDTVHRAMHYSLSNGGKRIRPVLVLEFCRICGGDVQKALPFAAAIEMVHTYSLIHDDLPCMDNDAFRRGKPSCHVAFGEEYALLAGDGLLTAAFGVIADSDQAKENPAAALKALSLLSSLAGANGMIGGQVVDLKNEDRQCGLDDLEKMDRLKTGALIKCSALLGAVCAGADEAKMNAAALFAEKLGHAFQIVDDILDVTGDEKELGKPIGSDAQCGKSTYVSVLGLEPSRKYAETLTREAIEALDIFGEEKHFLADLAEKLIYRNK
ncbi:MAG: polyprenyl synthetase family protein [Oscillospiraceae bacterium]|nr:polyprenyl synthetase family protein [Oscillospiraceae bacterium]